MSGHRQFRSLAAQAIDFELTAGERDLLGAHLRTCSACRLDAARLGGDAASLASRPRVVPPPGMRARFVTVWLPRAVRTSAAQARLLLAFAAVLVLGVSVLIGAGGSHAQFAPTASSMPTQGDHAIGRAVVIPLSAGPDVDGRSCARIELACASDIADEFGAVWTTATDAVVRLEPDTGRVLARIPIDGHPIRIAGGEKYLWVTVRAPGSVVRIDPRSNTIDSVVPLGGLPAGIAIDARAAWVADEDGRSVVRLSLADGHVTTRIQLLVAPWEVAATTDRIWVTNRYGDQLIEIDPEADRAVAARAIPGAAPMNSWEYGDGVATEDGSIYVASNTAVHQFDPLTASFKSALAPSLGHIALFQGHLWFASSFTRTVEERNPQTLEVLVTQKLAMSITGNGGDWDAAITVTGHSVWIRSYLDDAVIRLDRNDRE